jgi:hypothetical protein
MCYYLDKGTTVIQQEYGMQCRRTTSNPLSIIFLLLFKLQSTLSLIGQVQIYCRIEVASDADFEFIFQGTEFKLLLSVERLTEDPCFEELFGLALRKTTCNNTSMEANSKIRKMFTTRMKDHHLFESNPVTVNTIVSTTISPTRIFQIKMNFVTFATMG